MDHPCSGYGREPFSLWPRFRKKSGIDLLVFAAILVLILQLHMENEQRLNFIIFNLIVLTGRILFRVWKYTFKYHWTGFKDQVRYPDKRYFALK